MTRHFAVVSLGILVAACGGAKSTAKPALGDGGATYTATTTTQQFIDQVMGAECDFFVRCSYLPDKSTCLAYFNMATSLDNSSLAYSIDQGRMTLNTSNLAPCISAISGRSCDLSVQSSATLTASCSSLTVGTISSGGDCIEDGECKSGLECDKGSCTASCCPGVCVTAQPVSQIGGACAGDSTCVDSAFCKQTYNSTTGTITGVCLARAAVGAACSDYGGCVTSARCVGSTGSQTCVVLAKDGASCASSSSAGVSCANASSYCDPVKGTCQPRLKDNAACSIPDAGSALAAGCLSFSQCKNGVCKRLPMAGEACSNPDAAVLDECMVVGKCVDGVCQASSPKTLCTVATAKAAVADAGVRD